jgi:hypothetical protein
MTALEFVGRMTSGLVKASLDPGARSLEPLTFSLRRLLLREKRSSASVQADAEDARDGWRVGVHGLLSTCRLSM